MSRYILDAKGNKREVKGHKHRFKNLPEHLKGLPENLIGTDMADPDKVDEHDAPHIVGELIEQHAKTEKDKARVPYKKLKCAQIGEVVPLSQWEIDVVRMRVISSTVNKLLNEAKTGQDPDMSVNHLWFPEDNVNHYALRTGNPPSDRDRPKHLRGYRIEIDITSIPESVRDVIEEQKRIDALNAKNGWSENVA
jgi:hypothetical protein